MYARFHGYCSDLNWVFVAKESIKLFTLQEVGSFLRSYVVPEGFPASVNESYVPYMTFRAMKV